MKKTARKMTACYKDMTVADMIKRNLLKC